MREQQINSLGQEQMSLYGQIHKLHFMYANALTDEMASTISKEISGVLKLVNEVYDKLQVANRA